MVKLGNICLSEKVERKRRVNRKGESKKVFWYFLSIAKKIISLTANVYMFFFFGKF